MIEQHPADTAKPGDAFVDENGATWLLTGFARIHAWVVAQRVGGHLWHTSTDAHEHTLTPLVPAFTPEGVDIVAEWKKAAADRRAVADRLGVDCHIDAIIPAIRRLQVRAEDADAADRALAEKIVREHWRGGGRIDLALAGIRAGRDAERGALPPKDKDKGDE